MVFHNYSGLQPNLLKRSIFFAGVQGSLMGDLTDTLGISEGVLPVKYLVVPLITIILT